MERHSDSLPVLAADIMDADGASEMQSETLRAPAFDGRWAAVTGALTALIVGSVAWLAIQTMPPSNARGFETAQQEFIPYRLFRALSQSAESRLASWGWHGQERRSGGAVQQTPFAARSASEPELKVVNRTLTLDSGDTVAGMLQSVDVADEDINAAIAAMGKVCDLRSLRAGQAFDLVLMPPDEDQDEGSAMRLTSLKFSPSIEHDITVTRTAGGSYTANDALKKLVPQVHHAGTKIDSSLYLSAMRAGIPADVVVEMIHMFSYKVDFQRDIRPGDSFEVLYDYYYTPQGQPARVGTISYAKMVLGGQEIRLYRYQTDPDAPADYFDAKGQSAKGLLMKTPVDGARITSGFGMRFHPVLGYSRMHKGVDFGVPIGTPVMASGSGRISFIGWQHGYGKFVIINHGNGISTGYGHLSRFARGLHRGSRVRQTQIIAYSGMTGLATGPHLHYEIRRNNVQVNPLKVKIASGRKLKGRELHAFLSERNRIDRQMAKTPLETKVAEISAASQPK